MEGSEAIAGANLIVYVLFGVMGLIFYLFREAQQEKFDAQKQMIASVEKRFEDYKIEAGKSMENIEKESKEDDVSVTSAILTEVGTRMGQTTEIHGRVGTTEEKICKAENRIAYLEGLHDTHKTLGRE